MKEPKGQDTGKNIRLLALHELNNWTYFEDTDGELAANICKE